MAFRTTQHKIGSSGELALRSKIEDLGFATSSIDPDYGEDFFIFGEDDGVIEPFKIYVQAKTSEKDDLYKSDWTIYEDVLTVRNWVLGSDFTILVRFNKKDGIYKYCIPEDEVTYWDLPLDRSRDVALNCSQVLDDDAISQLMWQARIRHYERIVKITQPNDFEDTSWEDLPQFRLFCLEFLTRLGLMNGKEPHLSDYAYSAQLPLKMKLIEDCEFESSEDMTILEKGTYGACMLLILDALREKSGHDVGMPKFFLDCCSCLMVQLVNQRTEIENEKNSNK
ncbi:DUF4365 domain-containing protein [Aliikangiella maris]|uniref:DUF4365 domain-containing protein n=2 Tax=Aliikangiella maris TaxID=3162458 RepID=A0ABV2BVF8_9GAMM